MFANSAANACSSHGSINRDTSSSNMDSQDSCLAADGAENSAPNNVAKSHDDAKNDLHLNAGQQLGARGGQRGSKGKKLSFRDFVMKEVLASPEQQRAVTSARPHKSILKVRTEPLRDHESDEQPLSFVNKAYLGDEDEQSDAASSDTAITTVTTGVKPPVSRVWSTGSGSGGRAGFAELVDFLMQRTPGFREGRDTHPFGRDCTIEGILQSSRPKSHSKNSAFGKLVVWLTMCSILLGSALFVIYMSESYNATLEKQALLQAEQGNKTTQSLT